MSSDAADMLPVLKAGDVRLPVQVYRDKLAACLDADDLDATLAAAITFTAGQVPKEAVGKSCGLATVTQIRDRCTQPADHFTASGSLSQMDLRANALTM